MSSDIESEQVDIDLTDDLAGAAGVDETSAAADGAGSSVKQIRKEQRRVLFRSASFIVGMGILLFWVLAALFPGLFTSVDPKTIGWAPNDLFSSDTPLGTDNLGRSVWSRVIHGARPILRIAPVATLLAAVLGSIVGMLTGYFRGWVDEVISRILEAILSIPAILLAIVILFTSTERGQPPSFWVVTGTVAFLFIPPLARTVRAATLAESELDYVTAAKMRGESAMFIILREIFPNIVGVVIVEITVRLGYAIFLLATLAFLGQLGGDAAEADWGKNVAEQSFFLSGGNWWSTVYPALAIGSLVIAINLIADAIEKAQKS